MSRNENSRRARTPQGIRIYAVGDIHGRADLLDGVLARIDADLQTFPAPRALEVYMGDYIDRGPDSSAVIDRLIARGRNREAVFLRGNHEAFLAEFLVRPEVLTEWQRYGAFDTLLSYGLRPSLNPDPHEQDLLSTALNRALPEAHRHFLASLKRCIVSGDYLFAHAGIRPGIPLNRQREEDLLWIRDDFLSSKAYFAKIVVHGHTPVAAPEVHSNRINIDTGAYATNRLTCLVLERDEMLFL